MPPGLPKGQFFSGEKTEDRPAWPILWHCFRQEHLDLDAERYASRLYGETARRGEGGVLIQPVKQPPQLIRGAYLLWRSLEASEKLSPSSL